MVILLVFLVIHFIRPGRNESSEVLPADISKLAAVSDSIEVILKNVKNFKSISIYKTCNHAYS